MPIADFPGLFGWGYDGVDLYAPAAHLRAARTTCARLSIARTRSASAVILDVVYNHLGPTGNYLAEFSPDYFTDKYTNDWGRAINFEGPEPARAHFVQNARYWIEEFHFDGLRLDATQDIKDASPRHVIAEIVSAARAAAGRARSTSSPRTSRRTRSRPRSRARRLRRRRAVERRRASCRDGGADRPARGVLSRLPGHAQELISCARFGYLYQGQWYSWQTQRRGTPALDCCRRRFVTYLENHDQVANSAYGKRLHQLASPAVIAR
jgi:maltooligosyltrehalose trehalohydrolase